MQVTKWLAMGKWSRKYFKEGFSKCHVTVGDYQMRIKDFFQYMDHNSDDMPLYLFDKDFAKKAPHLGDEYEVPMFKAASITCCIGLACRHSFEIIAV